MEPFAQLFYVYIGVAFINFFFNIITYHEICL